MTTVKVITIGNRSHLRSQEALWIAANADFVEPIFLSEDQPFFTRVVQYLINGRSLTRGEQGCAAAHMVARQVALDAKTDWCLILEDDAEFGPHHYARLLTIISEFSCKNQEIFLFPSSMADVAFSEDEGPKLVRWKPTGAVAACYSSGALAKLPSASHWKYEVADWPSFFHGARFWRVETLFVGGVDNSQIGLRKTERLPYLLSLPLRIIFAPVLAWVLGLKIIEFIDWYFIRAIWSDVRGLTPSVRRAG